MKGTIKHCLVLALFIFCFGSSLLGQGENNEAEYVFVLQETENGQTNISWEGANSEGHLGYIFSLYDNLGGIERFQIIEPNVSVVLEENYSWDLEEVEVSSIVGYIEDLPDIIVSENELDIPIKEALTWYQGEVELSDPALEGAIYDDMELEVELIFDDIEFDNDDPFAFINSQALNDSSWENDRLTLYNSDDLSTLNSIKWRNRTSDTLVLELDYRIRYSADGVEEKMTNSASITLVYIYDFTSKIGEEIGARTAALEVYPTVFSEELNWAYPLSDEDAFKIDIFDANGRLVYSYQLDIDHEAYYQNLSTTDWSIGNYYCIFNCNGKIEKRQLMKLP